MTDTAGSSDGTAHWRPLVTVLAALAAIVLFMGIGGNVVEGMGPSWFGHGLSHALVALPLLLLVAVAAPRWPPPHAARPGRTGRRIVLIGLWGVISGQLLEVMGARVDEPGSLLVEGVAHTAGQIVTMLSLPLVIVGTLACLVAGAREGAVPQWAVWLTGVAAVALFMFMVIGAPSGG